MGTRDIRVMVETEGLSPFAIPYLPNEPDHSRSLTTSGSLTEPIPNSHLWNIVTSLLLLMESHASYLGKHVLTMSISRPWEA